MYFFQRRSQDFGQGGTFRGPKVTTPKLKVTGFSPFFEKVHFNKINIKNIFLGPLGAQTFGPLLSGGRR